MPDVTPRLKTVTAKRKTKRRPRVVCSIRGCKRPPKTAGMCRTHAVERADKLFSGLIRSHGGCQSGRDSHLGVLQCAHGFSRSYKAVRWDERNAWSLCAGCHVYFTHHPLEWDEWMLDRMGFETYWSVRTLALSHEVPDLADVIASLDDLTERMA